MTTISSVNPIDVDLDITTIKVSSNDTTPGYLADKFQSSTEVSVTVANEGGNEYVQAALLPTTVAVGSYNTANITVDSKGRVTAASTGSVPSAAAAGGDLANAYPNPAVKAISTGSQALAIGNITNGQFLQRSGNTIVGASASSGSYAGGDLDGTYPNPAVKAITTTDGPRSLEIGDIADGEFLKRSGSTIIGATISVSNDAGGDLDGTYPDPSVVAITTTAGSQTLAIGNIADGEYLKRSGNTIIGAASSVSTDAGGDLDGSYPDPIVIAITTTSGSQSLEIGNITNGQFLQRSGNTIVGASASATSSTTATNVAETRSGCVRYEAVTDADDDSVVVSATISNTTLTLTGTANPDYPRALDITITSDATQITAGTVTITGVGASGQSAVFATSLILGANLVSVVNTGIAFATITSVVVSGYAGGGGDSIKVGKAKAVGLPGSYSPTPSGFSVYKAVANNANSAVSGWTVNSTYGTIYPTSPNWVDSTTYEFWYTYQVTPTQNSHTH
jgi:hypothetical protein